MTYEPRFVPGWDSSKPSRSNRPVRITWLKASTLCQVCSPRLLVKVNDMQRSHSTRQDTPLESPRSVGMRLTFNSVLESSTSRVYVRCVRIKGWSRILDTRHSWIGSGWKTSARTLVTRFHSENSPRPEGRDDDVWSMNKRDVKHVAAPLAFNLRRMDTLFFETSNVILECRRWNASSNCFGWWNRRLLIDNINVDLSF